MRSAKFKSVFENKKKHSHIGTKYKQFEFERIMSYFFVVFDGF